MQGEQPDFSTEWDGPSSVPLHALLAAQSILSWAVKSPLGPQPRKYAGAGLVSFRLGSDSKLSREKLCAYACGTPFAPYALGTLPRSASLT